MKARGLNPDDSELLVDHPQARRRVHVEAETSRLCAQVPIAGELKGGCVQGDGDAMLAGG
jgi:hypothetical protein